MPRSVSTTTAVRLAGPPSAQTASGPSNRPDRWSWASTFFQPGSSTKPATPAHCPTCCPLPYCPAVDRRRRPSLAWSMTRAASSARSARAARPTIRCRWSAGSQNPTWSSRSTPMAVRWDEPPPIPVANGLWNRAARCPRAPSSSRPRPPAQPATPVPRATTIRSSSTSPHRACLNSWTSLMTLGRSKAPYLTWAPLTTPCPPWSVQASRVRGY